MSDGNRTWACAMSTGTRLVFVGDGVSDLPIAHGAAVDALFAKRGRALARVCATAGQPVDLCPCTSACVMRCGVYTGVEHHVFEGFAEVQACVEGMLDGLLPWGNATGAFAYNR